eukprot:COSAG06_NODE_2527_length_6720_cov_2.669687_1_plen_109_part_00
MPEEWIYFFGLTVDASLPASHVSTHLLLTNRVVLRACICIRTVYGATFEPVCEESEACSSSYDKAPSREGPDHQPVCKCSGDWNDAVEVVDIVQIPEGLKPGTCLMTS